MGALPCRHQTGPLRVELFSPNRYRSGPPPPRRALRYSYRPAEWIFTTSWIPCLIPVCRNQTIFVSPKTFNIMGRSKEFHLTAPVATGRARLRAPSDLRRSYVSDWLSDIDATTPRLQRLAKTLCSGPHLLFWLFEAGTSDFIPMSLQYKGCNRRMRLMRDVCGRTWTVRPCGRISPNIEFGKIRMDYERTKSVRWALLRKPQIHNGNRGYILFD